MAIIKTVSRVSRFQRNYSPGSRGSVSSDEDGHHPDDNSERGDDADSAAGSDDIDMSQLGEVGEEICQVGDEICSVPFELYDLPGLGDILSSDSWNNLLTDEERFSLAKYLPDMDELTFMRTLKELFSASIFHFESPLVKLFEMLKGGLCEPRVSLYQQGLNFIQRREYYHNLWIYQNSMVDRLIQIRDVWESCVGYSTEKKIRVLNRKRNQKSLMSRKTEDIDLDSDASGQEESDDGFWDKRLKDVQLRQKMGSQAVYSRRPTLGVSSRGKVMTLDLAKSGQKNPKRLVEVAGLSGSLRKDVPSYVTSVQHGLGAKSRAYGSNLTLLQQEYSNDAGKPTYEMLVKANVDSTGGSAMSKVGLLKQGRKPDFLKREDGQGQAIASLKGFPFSLPNDHLHSHGMNRNANQMADMDILADNRSSDKSYYGYGSQNFGQMNTVKDRAQHLLLKDNKVDWSEGSQPIKTKKTKKSLPMDQQVSFEERGVVSNKRKTGHELLTGESIDISSKGASHRTFLPGVADTVSRPPDFRWNILQDEIEKRSTKNRRFDLEALRGVGALTQSEETESDSSERGDEEDDKPLVSMFARPSAISRGRQFTSVKLVPDLKKEHALDRITYSSEKANEFGERSIPPFESSKRRQKGNVRDLSYLPNLGINDMQHFQKSVKNSRMQGEVGKRIHHPFSKAYQVEREEKGKDYDSYYDSRSNYMHADITEEDDDLYATPALVDDHAPINRWGKKGKNIEAHAIDRHNRPNMSLLGCKTITKKGKGKGKGKADMTYMDDLDESGYLHSSPHQQMTDPSLKKRGKVSSSVTTSDTLVLPADLSPETRSVKKQFTFITPTVHHGFSFSIIHLLSDVRMALITPLAEDASDPGKHNEKNNGEGNPIAEEQNKKHGSYGDPSSISSDTEKKYLPSLTIQEIVNRVRSNPGDPSILETQEPLQDLIRGVLKIFISKTAPLGVKGWKTLVSYERATKSWTWIGPVSSNSSLRGPGKEELSSEAWVLPHKMLVKLVDAFANWLKNGQETLQQIGSLPAPPMTLMQPDLDEKERFRDLRAQKSLTTISPSSEEMRAYFRKEEILRYSVPDRAFSYTTADGRKSIVAPLRRCGGKPNSKARDHYMLKPGRPPHVTVLCLVRDAAARLPGSIGTRSDVCTLIRDSQYIVEDVSDAQVNQVVSGALDRLHYERDPCVQFDGERKLWVYLHTEREEEDFEDDGTASTKKWKRQRKDGTGQFEPGTTDFAYHGSEEQNIGGSATGFDLSTDLNIEPSPLDEDEGAEHVRSLE